MNFVFKILLYKNEDINAIINPDKYNNIKASPLKLKPKIEPTGITKAIKIEYTGSLAEHVIKGVTKIVINLSFQFSIFLVAMMAGIAQAVPDTNGTTLLPLSPKGLNPRSIRNTTRLI